MIETYAERQRGIERQTEKDREWQKTHGERQRVIERHMEINRVKERPTERDRE